MGLVEVGPQEAPFTLVAAPPGRRSRHHLGAAALGDRETNRRALRIGVVVELEAPVESVARIQREGGHHGARAETGVQERLGGGRDRLRQDEAGVVAHSVLVRQLTRQQVRVRRQGHHVVGVGALEHPAFRRQPVEVRSRRGRVASETRRVGPQGVDRDQNDVPSETRSRRQRPGGRLANLRRTLIGNRFARRDRERGQQQGAERSQSDSRYSANCFASSALSPSGASSSSLRKSAAAASFWLAAILARPR